MKIPKEYNISVFINCPFDDDYEPIFKALIFSIYYCGFIPHCSLEAEDSSVERIEKIFSIINSCKFGIHDISRTELNKDNNLPRFNMPLELGIFLGAKKFGKKDHADKNCLILDIEKYRYCKFISDLAGNDIQTHNNNPETAIEKVRNWLNLFRKQIQKIDNEEIVLPGGKEIVKKYRMFLSALPEMSRQLGLSHNNLEYADFLHLIREWLKMINAQSNDK